MKHLFYLFLAVVIMKNELQVVAQSSEGSNCQNPATLASPTEQSPSVLNNLTTCGFGNDYSPGSLSAANFCGDNQHYLSGEDYVLAFTPNTTACYRFTMTTSSNWAGFFVFDTCLDSISSCLGDATEEVNTGSLETQLVLEEGQTYYIVIDNNADGVSPAADDCINFDFSVTRCLTGVVCSNALLIPSNFSLAEGYTYTGTTCGFSDDYNNSVCTPAYLGGDDFVFEFTPDTTTCFLIELAGTEEHTGLLVMDGCPDDTTANCIAFDGHQAPNPKTSVTLSAGITYYILVSTFPDPQCTDFTLSINPCLPPNEVQDCVGAITIPPCAISYTQETGYLGAGLVTNEVPESSCLNSGEKSSTWYKITIPTSGDFNFIIHANNPLDDYDWAVYDVTNNGCAGIPTGESPELSCNYAQSMEMTGTDTLSTQTSGNSISEPFNAPIPVAAGDVLMLLVNSFSNSPSGYVLDFNPYSNTLLGVSAGEDTSIQATGANNCAYTYTLQAAGEGYWTNIPKFLTISDIYDKNATVTAKYTGIYTVTWASLLDSTCQDNVSLDFSCIRRTVDTNPPITIGTALDFLNLGTLDTFPKNNEQSILLPSFETAITPNPTTGHFTTTIIGILPINLVDIQLFDVTGRLLHTTALGENRIWEANLPTDISGLFFLQIQIKDEQGRLIKEQMEKVIKW